jgi:hypothetical protein
MWLSGSTSIQGGFPKPSIIEFESWPNRPEMYDPDLVAQNAIQQSASQLSPAPPDRKRFAYFFPGASRSTPAVIGAEARAFADVALCAPAGTRAFFGPVQRLDNIDVAIFLDASTR